MGLADCEARADVEGLLKRAIRAWVEGDRPAGLSKEAQAFFDNAAKEVPS
jgi:hypothetical protein